MTYVLLTSAAAYTSRYIWRGGDPIGCPNTHIVLLLLPPSLRSPGRPCRPPSTRPQEQLWIAAYRSLELEVEPVHHQLAWPAMAISSALPCSSLLMAAAQLMLLASVVVQVQGITRHYDFNVRRRFDRAGSTTCMSMCIIHATYLFIKRMHAYIIFRMYVCMRR